MKMVEPTAIVAPRGVFCRFFFFLNCCSSPPTSCDVCEVHLAAAGSQLPVWEQDSFIPIAWNFTTWATNGCLFCQLDRVIVGIAHD